MTVAAVQEAFNKGASESGSHHWSLTLSLLVPNSHSENAQWFMQIKAKLCQQYFMQPLIFFSPTLFSCIREHREPKCYRTKCPPLAWSHIWAGMGDTQVSVLPMESSLFGKEKTDWYVPGLLICRVVKVRPELSLNSLSSLLI